MTEYVGLVEVKCEEDVGVLYGQRIERLQSGRHAAASAGGDEGQMRRGGAGGLQDPHLQCLPLRRAARLRRLVDRLKNDARRIELRHQSRQIVDDFEVCSEKRRVASCEDIRSGSSNASPRCHAG